jgi:serine protease Do
MKRRSACRAAALAFAAVAALWLAGAASAEPGWLGISIADVGEELAERLGGTFGPAAGNGVHVMDILPGAPSEAALRRGDVIVQVDAQPIWDVRQLQRLIRATPASRQVTLGVLRGARRVTVPVTVGPMPLEARAQIAGERFGFLVRERDPSAPDGGSTAPLMVALVEPESPAARADLKVLDRLLEVNGRKMAGLGDFERAVLDSPQRLSLLVQRGDRRDPIALTLTIGDGVMK